MIDLSPAGRSYLLAFADDEHMIGSRHANWIGLGPFLEEDLAFCSIAQDELGHALALYEMFIPAEEINRFALLRDPRDYRSCALAELECGSWDLALVRHWLYDTAEQLKWRALLQSSITEVAALAEQALRDEAFHTEHAAMFLSRVSADPEATTRESNQRSLRSCPRPPRCGQRPITKLMRSPRDSLPTAAPCWVRSGPNSSPSSSPSSG